MVSLGDQTMVEEGRRQSYAVTDCSWSVLVITTVTRSRINGQSDPYVLCDSDHQFNNNLFIRIVI